MNDVLTFDKDLNRKVLTGSALAAFEQYYDDAVVMQENNDAPCAGKKANRRREQEFFGLDCRVSRREGGAVRGAGRCELRAVVHGRDLQERLPEHATRLRCGSGITARSSTSEFFITRAEDGLPSLGNAQA
jgi:hypothetical protein